MPATSAQDECADEDQDEYVRDDEHDREYPGANADTAQRRAGSELRDAGVERMTPHNLKHTAASLAVSTVVNGKALQRILGHKSAAMTLDTYADLFEDDLRSVADKLNERVLAESRGDLWGTRPLVTPVMSAAGIARDRGESTRANTSGHTRACS
ncbi:tyrosine-type recombinase/integrase [Leifsonia sp. NPDC077715]|uniref:tyrosine-type recombinase/integrase n=1 Tax=Leifsonia sp. NPDC077715 TaxID=3155539 RepID=UPI0034289897